MWSGALRIEREAFVQRKLSLSRVPESDRRGLRARISRTGEFIESNWRSEILREPRRQRQHIQPRILSRLWQQNFREDLRISAVCFDHGGKPRRSKQLQTGHGFFHLERATLGLHGSQLAEVREAAESLSLIRNRRNYGRGSGDTPDAALLRFHRTLGWYAVDALNRVKKMVHHEPQAARMMEKNQRKEDGKRHP
jgi:hypothetical protein